MNRRQLWANIIFLNLSIINIITAATFQDFYFVCLLLQFPLIFIWGLLYGPKQLQLKIEEQFTNEVENE